PTVFGIGSSCPWRRRARRCVRAGALPADESYPACWRRTKRGLCQHQGTNLRIMICRCVVLSSKSQHKLQSSNSNQSLSTSLGAWSLEFLWCLGFGAYGRSWLERSDSRNVHLVMRAVARASLCNRNRSMPTAPRNSDIRRKGGLRNSKSPAVASVASVASLRITVFLVFSLQNSRDRAQCASNFAVVVTRTIQPQ